MCPKPQEKYLTKDEAKALTKQGFDVIFKRWTQKGNIYTVHTRRAPMTYLNEIRRIKGKVAKGRENLCDCCNNEKYTEFWDGAQYYQLCVEHSDQYDEGTLDLYGEEDFDD